MIASVIGLEKQNIHWDTSKPNGTMRKVMDVSKLKNLVGNRIVSFEVGIKDLYGDFLTRFG